MNIAAISQAYQAGHCDDLLSDPIALFTYLSQNPEKVTPHWITKGLTKAFELVDQNNQRGRSFLNAVAAGFYDDILTPFFQGLSHDSFAKDLMILAEQKRVFGLRAKLITMMKNHKAPIFDIGHLINNTVPWLDSAPKTPPFSKYFRVYQALSDQSKLYELDSSLTLSSEQQQQEAIYVFLKNIDVHMNGEGEGRFLKTTAFDSSYAQQGFDLAYSFFIHPHQPEAVQDVMDPIIDEIRALVPSLKEPRFIEDPYHKIGFHRSDSVKQKPESRNQTV